ncbi:inorganic diphosphatase [Blochmannia endosymbiont of Colobopsis nipponica]|uniref:inorganic diphosphatase n=1 Tax=Blochmannia endosymbiont of Colobopsis nipponica TaxID=2681987 RepID=UPI001783368E|nr:inorganic diphosphatase [Blochmannia endosymbiont of Colobopsis nipponica]QOI10761.1 inorganic diphosphatase [Blochmannia endosymbiont of Colobopsis nipponica]
MNFEKLPAGVNVPDDVYVVIEIPANSGPIKYEINKQNGFLFVDRFICSTMFYPCNYGYINNTLSLDKDPVDVLVPTSYPLQSKSVIRSCPIGMLKMIDESGEDFKIIAVPHVDITLEYQHIRDVSDLPKLLCKQIVHFFKHYKDLEEKKWVKIIGWDNAEAAKNEILCSFNRVIK